MGEYVLLTYVRLTVVEPQTRAYRLLVQYFGQEVLLENGEIDRQKLGQIIFSDPEKRRMLNSITHPEIHRAMLKQILYYFIRGWSQHTHTHTRMHFFCLAFTSFLPSSLPFTLPLFCTSFLPSSLPFTLPSFGKFSFIPHFLPSALLFFLPSLSFTLLPLALCSFLPHFLPHFPTFLLPSFLFSIPASPIIHLFLLNFLPHFCLSALPSLHPYCFVTFFAGKGNI